MLSTSDDGTRILTLKALGKIGDPVAGDRLHDVARSDAPLGVRTEAMLALQRVGDDRGGQMIGELLVDPTLPEQARAEPGVSSRSAKRWARRMLAQERAYSGAEPLEASLRNMSLLERWRTKRLIARIRGT